MKRFIVSDTHFDHANIIKYCARPFDSIAEMNNALIENWNNVVGKDDLVYHLGDFAFTEQKKIFWFRRELNGIIHLILGNHDKFYPYDVWVDAGFDRVSETPTIIDGHFILSHEPIFLTAIDPLHITTMAVKGPGIESSNGLTFHNFYGHLHDKSFNTPHYTNVCVECTNYTPLNFDEIINRLQKF